MSEERLEFMSASLDTEADTRDNWIELTWAIMGDRIRIDHGYRLYSALVAINPAIKNLEWQLIAVNGCNTHDGFVKLGCESLLGVRCALRDTPVFDAVANRVLRVGQGLIEVGEVKVRQIESKRSLVSKITTIKNAGRSQCDRDAFCISLGKQLAKLGVGALPTISKRQQFLPITELGKGDREGAVGYGVRFESVSDAESLILQRFGLGGKRRMGCGVFV